MANEIFAHLRDQYSQGVEAASKAQTPTLQGEIESLALETENLLAAARALSEALAPVSEPQADKTQAEVSEYPTTDVPMIDALRVAYRRTHAVRRLLQETQCALRLGGES